MPIVFNLNEKPRRETQRILRDQINEIIAELKNPAIAVRDIVHDTRTGCKKTRAVLRLIQPHIPARLYQRENLRFRDAARPLTKIRDAEVSLKTLDKLYGRQRRYISKKAYQRLRKRLEENYHAIRQEMLEKHRALDHAMDIAKSGLHHVGELKPDGKGWPMIADGLKQTYRRGHKAYKRVADVPTMENMHEWRKQAKYLWYQLELMKKLNKPSQKLGKKLQKLTDLLGDEHDLAMLQHRLASDHIAHQKVDADIAESLVRQRKKLQKRILELGRKTYSEKPKRFIKHAKILK